MAAIPPNTTSKPTRRRWLQFSLRTLLIAITLFACLAAWVRHKHEQARWQWQALAWAHEHGQVTSMRQEELSGWKRPLIGYFYPPQLETLTLDEPNLHDLSPLAAMTNLKSLEIGRLTPATRLPAEATFPLLQKLSLRSTSITDIAPLATAVTLQEADLSYTPITDFSPLANCNQLHHLQLNGTSIDDLTPLAGMTELKQLHLAQTEITDLSPLANVTTLEELHLGHVHICRRPKPNRAPPSSTNGSTLVTDISPVAGLVNLRVLNLGESPVEDLSPVAQLHKLNELIVYAESDLDLSPLLGLKTLGWLSIIEAPGYTMDANNASLAALRQAIPMLLITQRKGDPHRHLSETSGPTNP